MKLTIMTVGVWRLCICWTRGPSFDVSGGDEKSIFKWCAWLGELLDVLEGDTCGVAFTAGGKDGAFVTLVRLCRKRDSRSLEASISTIHTKIHGKRAERGEAYIG